MRYIVGDIHGMYSKLRKVLDYASFDSEKDTLYSTGDFSDRGSESLSVLRFLMGLGDNFRAVYGNHDYWLYQFLNAGVEYTSSDTGEKFSFSVDASVKAVWDEKLFPSYVLSCWLQNGGRATIKSLAESRKDERDKIKCWLGSMPYRIEAEDYFIAHTYSRTFHGPDYSMTMKEIDERDLIMRDYDSAFWDREMLSYSEKTGGKYRRIMPEERKCEITDKPLIIGHSPTPGFGLRPVPVYDSALNFILLDTGSFVDKETYHLKEDGEITVFNMDEKSWVTSSGERGKFDL